MADRDLNLQLRLTKDQARQELAAFGNEAKAQIADDLSQFQAAEQSKVAAARTARQQRATEDASVRKENEIARKAAIAAEIAENQTVVWATLAAEQAKQRTAVAAEGARRAAIKETWLLERQRAADGVALAAQAAHAATAAATTAAGEVLALEGKSAQARWADYQRDAQAAQQAEAQKTGFVRAAAASQQAASKATALAHRQATTQQISQGHELVLASAQDHRQLAAIEHETAQAGEQRSVATRSAMQIEIAETEELGQAYVRVRMVQETQTQSIKQLGGTVAQSMKPGKDSVDGTKDSVESLGKAFLALQVVNQVAGWIREAMQAVAQSVQQAREHIKGMVEEMEAARTAAKELAALRGEKATGSFTATLAREAATAGLDVEKYNQVQLGFQAQAAQYIGEEGATPEQLAAQGKKISKDQAQGLQHDVASFAVGAKGLSAEDSSTLLGTVIAKMKAGSTNDEIMSEYAKIMKIAELAPGRTSEIVGQFSELGMESVGPTGDFKNLQQAAYLGRVMAQRNPREASTYGRSLLRGLREIGGDETKRTELGITKDMDVMQQLEQVDKKAKAHVAGGGKENEFIQKYFPDIRMFGAVRVALDEGIRGGGFNRAMAEAESVNAGTVKRDIKGYLGGEEGVAASQRSTIVAEERQSASFYAPLRKIEQDQKILMRQSHELERPETWFEATMTKSGELFGQGTREEQQLRKRTAYDLTSRLKQSKEGRDWLDQRFGNTNNEFGRLVSGSVPPNADERTLGESAQILQKIHDHGVQVHEQRQREKREEQRQRQQLNQPVPLVVAPQARGGARMH